MPRTTAQSPTTLPSAHDIAKRAYELYVDRARADGCDLDDWHQAERELRATLTPPARTAAKKVKGPMKRA